MAFDAFLQVTDPGKAPKIVGETQDPDFPGAFEITEFSFGAENTLNISSATGGAGAGKATFKEFTVKKQTDSSSGILLKLLGTGGTYKKVMLYLRKSGGGVSKGKSGKPYLVFGFGMMALKSIEWSGSSGDDVPTETVIFEYGEMMVMYRPQLPDGGLDKGTPLGWSKLNNSDSPTLITAADFQKVASGVGGEINRQDAKSAKENQNKRRRIRRRRTTNPSALPLSSAYFCLPWRPWRLGG